jgi:hypothetical protein
MRLGGVENDAEFDESLRMLRSWLSSFRDDTNRVHRENAHTLDDFLTMKIMPHKSRFFFAGRDRRMTLDQKATSALESINQKIKVMSGKRVSPNMSLLETIRTLDIQNQNTLNNRRIQAATIARSRSLHASSSTANCVTKPCESQVAQQTAQSPFYACSLSRLEKGSLLLKRLPADPLYCGDCEKMKETDDEQCCPVHSASSPIPSYCRIRSVDIISAGQDGKYWELRCSCLYHPTHGIPCRHIIAVLYPILPEHIFVRWHTKFSAYYKREHCEAITEEFHRKKRDLRLIITDEQRNAIVETVRDLEALHLGDLPHDFWKNEGAFCRSTDGLVSLDSDDFDSEQSDSFAGGFLSQDIQLSQYETEDRTTMNQDKHLRAKVIESSNLYMSCRSAFTSVCDYAKHCADPVVMENIVRKHLSAMQLEVSQHQFKKLQQQPRAFNGDFVSPIPAFDTRKVAKRIRAKCEPPRRRHSAEGARVKGVRQPVTLDLSSVLPSSNV